MTITKPTVDTIAVVSNRPIVTMNVYLIVGSRGERGVAAQQDVQNHADSPYVNLEIV